MLEKAAIGVDSETCYFTSVLTHSSEYCAAKKERAKEIPFVFWTDKPDWVSCAEKLTDLLLQHLVIFCHVICHNHSRRHSEGLQTTTQGAACPLLQ